MPGGGLSSSGSAIAAKRGRVDTLLQLQNKVKRDPPAYRDEVLLQLKHFDASLALFQLTPGRANKDLCDLVSFLSHVTPLYPKEAAAFPAALIALLRDHAGALNQAVRRTVVQALCLLRNRNAVPATDVLPLFFQLFRARDRELRSQLLGHIIGDVKRMNAKVKNPTENRQLQNFMYKVVSADDPVQARHSLWVILDLYRRGIWTDDRVVNVVSAACFSKHTKVMTMALRFFMGHFPRDMEQAAEEEEGDDNDELRMPSKKQRQYAKKTKARKTAKDKLKSRVMSRERRKEGRISTVFKPIEVLNDPQGFAERLFAQLQHTKERFDVKLLHIGVIAKLVSAHDLMLLNLYPFLQRYMEPHQQHVTHILAWTAQSVHDLVPPDSVHSLLMTIANHFVNDKASPDAIAVGINTIREICKRQPRVMTEDLLQDIAQYKRFKRDKGVVMASRSLIQLFKELQPDMLARKDRGRQDGDAPKIRGFGSTSAQGIDGLDLLQEHYQKKAGGGDEDEDDKWSASGSEADASSEGSGSWVDVPQDGSDDGSDGDAEMDDVEEGEELEEMEEDEEEGFDAVDDTAGGQECDKARMAKEAAAKAVDPRRLDETKLLTPRDFALLKDLQQQRDGQLSKKEIHKRKRKAETETTGGDVTADVVELHTAKRRRRDAEERAAHTEMIRERFKAKTKLKKKAGGSTNTQKRRGKLAQMVMSSDRVRKKMFETPGSKRKRGKLAAKQNIKFRIKRR
eukprot:TRINITY_DN998_c3_g1_i1.p1 TRINITY_DN998_c3_g1~~TRINITY_DN998_c3_g1_i1.p1  ORF type:complete len:758 (+),score=291.52 TRINITY_DN998_c3_g1_i1:58-2274(+)